MGCNSLRASCYIVILFILLVHGRYPLSAVVIQPPSCTRFVYEEDTCRAPWLSLFAQKTSLQRLPNMAGDYYSYKIANPRRNKRNALRCQKWLWPSGIIPYWFAIRNKAIAQRFQEAVREFNDLNCVQFLSLNTMLATLPLHKQLFPRRFLVVVQSDPYPGSRCQATVGTTATNPKMLLSTVCTKGQILHELMHVLGFSHEHMRPDRDQYVSINCGNIFPNVTGDFRRLRPYVVDTFHEPYDFASIMHYTFDHFSRNGEPTITPLSPVQPDIQVGRMESFSESDIRRIRKLYNCPS